MAWSDYWTARHGTQVLLAMGSVGAYIFMICLIYSNSKAINIDEHTFRSLHALEYPATSSQLSLLSFRTPGLPTRLASTWEIQNELKITPDALASVYDMLYPTMQHTIGMQHQLREHTPAPCTACGAQSIFDFKNVLIERQTQHYCPLRGETMADWLTRTRQPNSTDIETRFNEYNKFNFNVEHAQLCRANRSPVMALAHVATHTFSLFSLQSNVILSMYLSTVHVLFMSSICIYLWYGHVVFNTKSTPDKIALHGKFSLVFFVTVLLSIIPVFADYFHREDRMIDTTNDATSKPIYGTKAVGSYVLGLWTIMYAFVYIKIIPPLIPAKKEDETKPGSSTPKANQNEDGASDPNQKSSPDTSLDNAERGQDSVADGNKPINGKTVVATPSEVVRHFDAQQRVICFAYWNLAQAPCIVMIVLTQHRYGVDMDSQFAIFGAIAVGLLDVLQTRVAVILGVLRKINYDGNRFDTLAWGVFLFVKCIIAIPVLLNLHDANISGVSMAAIAIVFATQTFQNFVLLVMSRFRDSSTIDLQVDTHIRLFYVSLGLHVAVSLAVFIMACGHD